MTDSSLPRGRFAPSPTGLLHVGSARTALAAWLSVRSRGGAFLWRIEDLDPPRAIAGTAEAALEDLGWLGLDWDEGPDAGGPHAPYVQSERYALYEAALDRLAEAGRLFPCRVSRSDLREIASAPHGVSGLPPYPPSLRPASLPLDWLARLRAKEDADAALRFRVHDAVVRFEDRVQGVVEERVSASTGDFVLKRRDELFAYQLAVVVDDLAMGVTEVVRGADLLDSTARQVQLIEALGGTPPAYAHLPLVVNAEGEKLSKRDEGLTLRSLRAAGVVPDSVVGALAHSLALADAPTPVSARALVPRFRWGAVPRDPWRLPDDFAERLRRG
ncbi:MAG: tRNA glutamyl-Q(34) synthetase GluQRS [Rhodothermales bacterium]